MDRHSTLELRAHRVGWCCQAWTADRWAFVTRTLAMKLPRGLGARRDKPSTR
ncbi:MAG: hypothetical protein NZT92_02555 [Abditibacteriales bacterium]|nr:hypothetical protein [Abditibacteriales bacterium]MDW8364704.1 hypothetical protein [Abditibacteriales bacterium]